jgi:hypothetical protein
MGCGDPKDCETSRIALFLDNRHTDGSEIVMLYDIHYLSIMLGAVQCQKYISDYFAGG